jgi:hypothetical protein
MFFEVAAQLAHKNKIGINLSIVFRKYLLINIKARLKGLICPRGVRIIMLVHGDCFPRAIL